MTKSFWDDDAIDIPQSFNNVTQNNSNNSSSFWDDDAVDIPTVSSKASVVKQEVIKPKKQNVIKPTPITQNVTPTHTTTPTNQTNLQVYGQVKEPTHKKLDNFKAGYHNAFSHFQEGYRKLGRHIPKLGNWMFGSQKEADLIKQNSSVPYYEELDEQFNNGQIDKDTYLKQYQLRTDINNAIADRQYRNVRNKAIGKTTAELGLGLIPWTKVIGLGKALPAISKGIAKAGTNLINKTGGKFLNQAGQNAVRGTMNNALRVGNASVTGAVDASMFAPVEKLTEHVLDIPEELRDERTLAELTKDYAKTGAVLGGTLGGVPLLAKTEAGKKAIKNVSDKTESFLSEHPKMANAVANIQNFFSGKKSNNANSVVDKYATVNDKMAKVYGGGELEQLSPEAIEEITRIADITKENSDEILADLIKGKRKEIAPEVITPEQLINDSPLNETLENYSQKYFNKPSIELTDEECEILAKNILDEINTSKVPLETPQSNLSHVELENNVNTQGDDLTHVNEAPSHVKSNIQETPIEKPKKVYPKSNIDTSNPIIKKQMKSNLKKLKGVKIKSVENSTDDFKVTKLESGKAEGADSLYENQYNAPNKHLENDAIENNLQVNEPSKYPEYVKDDPDFIKWYNRYSKADDDTKRKLLEVKLRKIKKEKGSAGASEFYDDVMKQNELDIASKQPKQIGDKTLSEQGIDESGSDVATTLAKEFKEQDITNKKIIEVNISEAEKTQANSKIKSQFPSKLQSKFKTSEETFDALFNSYHQNNVPGAQKLYDKWAERIKLTKSSDNVKREMYNILNRSAKKFEDKFGVQLSKQSGAVNIKARTNDVLDQIKTATEKEDFNTLNDLLKNNKQIIRTVKDEQGLNTIRSAYDSLATKTEKQIDELLDNGKIEEAKQLFNKSQNLLKNKYTDFSKKERTEFINNKKVKTGTSWERTSDDLTQTEWIKKQEEFKNKIISTQKELDDIDVVTKHLKNETSITDGKTRTVKLSRLAKFKSEFKDFEDIDADVVFEFSDNKQFGGAYNPAENKIKINLNSDKKDKFETIYHETQHYYDMQALKKSVDGSRLKALEQSRLKRTNQYSSHVQKYQQVIKEVDDLFDQGKSAIEVKKIIGEEKVAIYKEYNKLHDRYTNCFYERRAVNAGSNKKLDRKYYDRTHVLSTSEAQSKIGRIAEKNTSTSRGELQGLSQKTAKNRTESKELDRNIGGSGSVSTSRGERLGISEQNRQGTSGLTEDNNLYEVSKGKNIEDVGAEKAKEKLNITDNDIKTSVKESYHNIASRAENLAKKLGILSDERSINRLKQQVGKDDISDLDVDYVKKMYEPSGNSKGGIDVSKNNGKLGNYYQKKKDGVSQRAHIKHNFIDRYKETKKLENIDDGLNFIQDNFAKPITDNIVQDGYVAVNRKVLANAMYGRQSQDWYKAITSGKEEIAKQFTGKEAQGWSELFDDLVNPETNKIDNDFQIPKVVFDKLFEGGNRTSKMSKGKANRYLTGLVDFENNNFKRKVLGLSVSWGINNRLDNFAQLFTKSMDNPIGLAKNYVKAIKLKDADVLTGVETNTLFGNMKEFQGRIDYTGHEATDNFLNLINGHTLDNSIIQKNLKAINTNSKTIDTTAKKYPHSAKAKRRIADLKAENERLSKENKTIELKLKGGNVLAIPNKVANKIAKSIMSANEKLEKYERKVAYLQALDKHSKEILKNVSQNINKQTEIFKLMKDEIEKSPELREKILREVNNTLGDYNVMTPFEKNVCKRVVPFYAWYRTITRYMVSLSKEHPVRVITMLHEKRKIEEENAYRKHYQKYIIPLNKPSIKDGKITFTPALDKTTGEQLGLNLQRHNVTSTFDELTEGLHGVTGMLSPAIKTPIEGIRGKKFFGDGQIQTKRYRPVSEYVGKNKEGTYFWDKGLYDTKTKTKLRTEDGKLSDKLPAKERAKYVGMQFLKDTFPLIDNNTVNGTKMVGAVLNKLDKSDTKSSNVKGKLIPYDKLYDTDFGGYNTEDIIGIDETKSKLSKKRYMKEYSNTHSVPTQLMKTVLGGNLQTIKPLNKREQAKAIEEVRKRKLKHKKRLLY